LERLPKFFDTPVEPLFQTYVNEGIIEMAVAAVQRHMSEDCAYFCLLDIASAIAPYHLDVVIAANVPQIIFSKMAQPGWKLISLQRQKFSMRTLSCLVCERDGSGTTIDFFDEKHDMTSFFKFVDMQPRRAEIDAEGMRLCKELTINYPEIIGRMCDLGLLRVINKITPRNFNTERVRHVFDDAVSIFEILSRDATNLRALSNADPYSTLRIVMQRHPESTEVQNKALYTIAALADLHPTIRCAPAPVDVVTMVLTAMTRAPCSVPGFFVLVNLLHNWRNVETIVNAGGVTFITSVLEENFDEKELILVGLEAICTITSRIKHDKVLTQRVQEEGSYLIKRLVVILEEHDDIIVLRQVLKVFSDFVVHSPEMRLLCLASGPLTDIIRVRELSTKDKKMAQRIVRLLRTNST
jgi:hypothetical protein